MKKLSIKAATLAKIERPLREFITFLPPKLAVSIYSRGRLTFLDKLKKEILYQRYTPPENLSRILWGIKFRSPIMNAAGMFKNGECYEVVAKQGAAAYLGGTGTWDIRRGREKMGIFLPFIPYPQSGAASNNLSLPNHGNIVNSRRVAQIKRVEKCPIGWSIGIPDHSIKDSLENLVKGMRLYEQAGVDFLEMNESCPNTKHGKPKYSDLAKRLEYVKENFLDSRARILPVIIKFSNDTKIEQVPKLLDLLFKLGYDGVNFGNTSTSYDKIRNEIENIERRLYDFFIKTFEGGVSGRPLKKLSLELAASAVEYLNKGKPAQEFHVIRTGGIESWEDIQESEAAGISLNQWFTGYFEKFAEHGHSLYKKLLRF